MSIATTPPARSKAVLELTVNNHAGVLMHVCSLFSRRAYNVEGVLCMPIGDGTETAQSAVANCNAEPSGLCPSSGPSDHLPPETGETAMPSPAPNGVMEPRSLPSSGPPGHLLPEAGRRELGVAKGHSSWAGNAVRPKAAGSGQSRIWLLVNEQRSLEQMEKQLRKLEDVKDVRRHGASHDVFVRLEEFFR
jgi:acetolactate synthase regulatory subunit